MRTRHILSFWLALGRLFAADQLTWHEQTSAGERFREAGKYAEARDAFVAALEIAKRENTSDYRYALSLHGAGIAEYHLGNHEQALSFLLEGHRVAESVLPPGHTYFAKVLSGLGAVYRRLNRVEDAEAAYKSALAAAERSYGLGHPETASVIYNRAFAKADQGRFDEARKDTEQALKTYHKAFGEEDTRVATIISGLAWILSRGGQFPEAARSNLIARRSASGVCCSVPCIRILCAPPAVSAPIW